MKDWLLATIAAVGMVALIVWSFSVIIWAWSYLVFYWLYLLNTGVSSGLGLEMSTTEGSTVLNGKRLRKND